LTGEDGRSPDPPDPAYQQILRGIPAADFSAEELLYLPRNLRAHRLYGMSPVEQIALTINIALRRDAAALDYYRAGSTPDAFATLPKEWTADQIRSFQDYFDALMSGNLARRRQTKFMPADFKLIEARQPPLKDQYDEWLARIICYAFSVPASPFVSQVNRATSETLRQQATREGLVPLKAWMKNALDHMIQVCMNEPGLEFVWVGDDAVDPLEQAQTLQILVGAGIKTREDARADLGLGPQGGRGHRGCCAYRCTTPASADPRSSKR
jgi:portal protein